ncbi:MAG TPA: hypothetical protein VG051_05485 [Candidatus Acidoferrum sp.]|jgi:hypothetical protein|nr:hypothetical protein [Candidatus Acidoferrum sp.]
MRRFVKYMDSSTFGGLQKPSDGGAAKRQVNLLGSTRIQLVEREAETKLSPDCTGDAIGK